MGYVGGTKADPTYDDLGDHAEAVQIEYDPAKITYRQLLDIFWRGHDPTKRSRSRQYMAAIFYHDDQQERLARETAARVVGTRGMRLETEILAAPTFWPAEGYHQKFRLRHHGGLMREFRAMYRRDEDFVASTAAARVNGYVDGCGSLETVRKALPELGLSAEGAQRLLEVVGAQRRAG